MGWKGRIGKGGEGAGKGRGEDERGGREVRGRKEKEWPPLFGSTLRPCSTAFAGILNFADRPANRPND